MSVDRNIEVAKSWLYAAQTDLQVSDLLMREGFFSYVCLACQQAAEKALKAQLLAHGRGLVRTHFLPRLLQECRTFEPAMEDLSDACAVLAGYYTEMRYPDSPVALDGYDADMAGEALALARRVVALVHEAAPGMLDLGSSARRATPQEVICEHKACHQR